MDKKDIKSILILMRTSENDEIINNLLGKIDMMDEASFQNALQQVGRTEETVRTFFEKKILEKQNTHTEEHTPINEMFSYGVSGNCIHLHLPTDLHESMVKNGISKTMALVNLHLLDAIDKIKAMKDRDFYKFKDKDSIYMISPAMIKREMRFLEELDFTTHSYSKKQLSDSDFVQETPEAQLAVHIFGKDKNVGTASIRFDIINSKEWQEKRNSAIQSFKEQGILLDDNINER